MTTLWRLHLRPVGIDPRKAVDHCLENGLIGLGWQVDGDPPLTPSDYLARAGKEYGHPVHAVKRLMYELAVGDLVWVRSLDGRYMVAEITGDWRYDGRAEAAAVDIVNVRPARIHQIGASDRVPGKVLACFRPSGPFQRIRDETSLIRTQNLCGLPFSSSATLDLFSLLNDVELEDLVLIYLQVRGWIILPNSRARDTVAYEAVLVNRETRQRAYVQIKSGDVRLRATDYGDGSTWFLFAGGGVEESAASVHVITKADLLSFASHEPEFLTGTIANLIAMTAVNPAAAPLPAT